MTQISKKLSVGSFEVVGNVIRRCLQQVGDADKSECIMRCTCSRLWECSDGQTINIFKLRHHSSWGKCQLIVPLSV